MSGIQLAWLRSMEELVFNKNITDGDLEIELDRLQTKIETQLLSQLETNKGDKM